MGKRLKAFTFLFFASMKHFLILLMMAPAFLRGQVTFNVQSNFGNPYVCLRSVVPTDSCYYATGIIQDSANAIGTLFIKFDLNGDTILTKKLISPAKWYGAWFGDMLQTADGGLLEIGQVVDSIQKGGIFKFTTEGDTVFTREYPSPFPDNLVFTPYEIVQASNGRYCILNAIESSDYNNQLLISFLDSDLEVEFYKAYGNPGKDEIAGTMLATGDGGLIVGSNRDNTNTNQENFNSRTYIFQVDSLGALEWEYLSPANQLRDIAYSMVKTPDGGLVVASARGIEHAINADVSVLLWQGYLFKLDANHQQVWGRDLRGTRHTLGPVFAKVVPATDGAGFVAYGRIGETVSDGTEQYGSWVVKVSNQGDSLWARYYTFFDGHDRRPEPIDFKPTPDGGYIVAGQTQEGLENWGWLMKLDSFGCLVPGCNANDGPNATAQGPAPVPELAIHPNPVGDFLNFELRTPGVLQKTCFRIVDQAGRVQRELWCDSPRGTFVLPVRGWPAGVYFLQCLEAGVVRASERFVVAR